MVIRILPVLALLLFALSPAFATDISRVADKSSKAAASKTEKVEVFVTDWCPYCRSLEAFLKAEKITYVRHDIEKSAKGRMMYEELGGGGIPLTRIGTKVFHGFDESGIRSALGK